MEEEKQSEFSDYLEYTSDPWECLYRFVRYHHHNDNIVMRSGLPKTPFDRAQEGVYWTGVLSDPTAELTHRPIPEMRRDFFHSSGRPLYSRLMQHADKWVVWAVTKGRYRMDRCKNMYRFTGRAEHCYALNLKHGSKGFWERVPNGESYAILEEITDVGNDLLEAILKKLKKWRNRGRGDIYKCCLDNFKRLHMLQLKMFDQAANSCLTPGHRQRRWFYRGKRKSKADGGGRAKSAYSEPLPVPSVHNILKCYHQWCPSMR